MACRGLVSSLLAYYPPASLFKWMSGAGRQALGESEHKHHVIVVPLTFPSVYLHALCLIRFPGKVDLLGTCYNLVYKFSLFFFCSEAETPRTMVSCILSN